MSIALTRSVPDTFASATVAIPGETFIDVAIARKQHAAYVRGLGRLGLTVVELLADDAFPDCCFVEDCALVVDGVALVTRPGAESRRGETLAVVEAFEHRVELRRIERMDAPATLDGGDCLRVGRHIFVGLSARTNASGIARIREVFGPEGFRVVLVPLSDVLHLKCVCSPLGEERILLAEGTIPRETFVGIDVVMIPNAEAYAANCVARSGMALVAAGFPLTQALLERAGIEPIPIETTEMRKADGSLTCLSIVL